MTMRTWMRRPSAGSPSIVVALMVAGGIAVATLL
jgi:hypothetical protein